MKTPAWIQAFLANKEYGRRDGRLKVVKVKTLPGVVYKTAQVELDGEVVVRVAKRKPGDSETVIELRRTGRTQVREIGEMFDFLRSQGLKFRFFGTCPVCKGRGCVVCGPLGHPVTSAYAKEAMTKAMKYMNRLRTQDYSTFLWAVEMWDVVRSIKGLRVDVREVATEEGAEISADIALKIVQTFANKDGWGVKGVGLGVAALAPRQRKWLIPSKADPQHRGIVIEKDAGAYFLGFYNKDF